MSKILNTSQRKHNRGALQRQARSILIQMYNKRRMTLQRYDESTSGASAVEFAIVLPVLALLIFGAAYLGIYIGLGHSLQQLSADVSRYAMVGLSPEERRTLARVAIDNSASNYPLISSEWLSYRIEEDSQWLTVEVTYDLTNSNIPNLLSPSLGQIGSLERSATVMLP